MGKSLHFTDSNQKGSSNGYYSGPGGALCCLPLVTTRGRRMGLDAEGSNPSLPKDQCVRC